MNNKKYTIAIDIIKELQKNNFDSYLVGGVVRNSILHRKTKDIDIVTSATPDDIKKIFKKTKEIGISFGITNVIKNNINYDVATFRNESNYQDGRHPNILKYAKSPKNDYKRRDFTINALYYDPIKNKILDFTNGLDDINKQIIRTVGNPIDRFNEDYLRMLRAIRFASELKFKIDKNTILAIQKNAHKITKLPADRIREELNLIFTSENPDIAMQLLYDTKLMQHIIPELSITKGITQPKKYHPEGDVFEHIKLMLKNMIIKNITLVWSILLHDIGKPKVIEIDKNGIEKFHLHENIGYKMSIEILKKFNFSNKLIYEISNIVKNHMKFAHVKKMRISKIKQMISSNTFSTELELHRLDCISSNKITENFIFLIDKIIEQNGKIKLPKPLINGNDIIQIGLKQGKIIGQILNKIKEKQLENILTTKQQAIEYIKKNYLKI